MHKPSNVITRIDKITNAVIYIIKQSREDLVLVSPYLQLQFTSTRSWKEFDDAMNGAIARSVNITFISRTTDAYNRKDAMKTLTEWRQKGCSVYLLDNLHAKIYYSESLAIVSSMNLYLGSTIKNYECAVVIDRPPDLEALGFYIEEMKESSLKYSEDGKHVVNKQPAPSGLMETWFQVTNTGSKYVHVKLEGKYHVMVDLKEIKGTVERGKSYRCHADVKWRTVRGKKRVYMERVMQLVEK